MKFAQWLEGEEKQYQIEDPIIRQQYMTLGRQIFLYIYETLKYRDMEEKELYRLALSKFSDDILDLHPSVQGRMLNDIKELCKTYGKGSVSVAD